MTSTTEHVSVMRDRCVDLLSPAISASTNPVVVDATLGLGGHTEALLQKFPHLTVIGIDRDLDAIAKATTRLAPFADRLKTAHSTFDGIAHVVAELGYTHIDGALFDLGVSSMQLDQSERGFSYAHDAPLDMRMDRTQSLTAGEIINTYEPGQLVRILRTYGEEKFATRIVESIVKQRAIAPMNSTAQLATLVKEAIPAATRRTGGNPAKRTFQALRIETNDELGTITRALPAALDLLNVGARLVVMSFQSLEDRIVKRAFAAAAKGCICPPKVPLCGCGVKPSLRLLTDKPLTASEEEVARNPRSRSAKLRVAERIEVAA